MATLIGRVTLASTVLSTALAAQQPPAAAISQQELISRTERSVDSLVKQGLFSGVVVISKAGAAVFQRAYGMADREAKVPNTLETSFNLGSINKVFTATAIRQLAREGKIDLDSTLARYLPDYPNADVAKRVTIRQILEMRSGIAGNIFAAPASRRRHDILHNRDYVPLFANEPLAFEPGTQRQYSNAGYIVLGLVIERVSGEDYYSYVRDHIYAPAGMSHTTHYAADSLPRAPFVAIGYTTSAETGGGRLEEAAPTGAMAWTRNTETLPGRGSAAGGGYSTAADLLRFADAMRAHRIPGAPAGGLGAAGGAPGINAVLETDLPGGYDVVVLTNLDPPAAERVARMVRGWLGARDG